MWSRAHEDGPGVDGRRFAPSLRQDKPQEGWAQGRDPWEGARPWQDSLPQADLQTSLFCQKNFPRLAFMKHLILSSCHGSGCVMYIISNPAGLWG